MQGACWRLRGIHEIAGMLLSLVLGLHLEVPGEWRGIAGQYEFHKVRDDPNDSQVTSFQVIGLKLTAPKTLYIIDYFNKLFLHRPRGDWQFFVF